MLIKSKIPFINENEKMKKALKIINDKGLGFLVIFNKGSYHRYIYWRRFEKINAKKRMIDNFKIKKFMTKKPYAVEKNTLISDILFQMNKKNYKRLRVFNGK